MSTPAAPPATDTDPTTVLRVVVAEDNFLVREAIGMVFAAAPEIEVVANCDSLGSVREAVAAHSPDVVVSDIRMPPSAVDEGIQLATELRETQPEMGVVILSQFLEAAYVVRLFERGASGRAYLLKDRITDRNQLLRAVETVSEGGSVIDPLVVDELVKAREAGERSPLAELTPREREVLAQVAEGKSNAAIAAQLFLTKRAVEKYVHAIFIKLGMSDDVEYSRRVKAALLFLGHRPPG